MKRTAEDDWLIFKTFFRNTYLNFANGQEEYSLLQIWIQFLLRLFYTKFIYEVRVICPIWDCHSSVQYSPAKYSPYTFAGTIFVSTTFIVMPFSSTLFIRTPLTSLKFACYNLLNNKGNAQLFWFSLICHRLKNPNTVPDSSCGEPKI